MLKSLHINADKCTGCLQCEMACSFENYGVFAPAKSRIKVFDFHATGKKVRGPAPLSLALAHMDVTDDVVVLSPWTETDFRTGLEPWWK